MPDIELHIDGAASLECRTLTGQERLGEAGTFDVELFAPEPLDTAGVLGKPCAITLRGGGGGRVVHGFVVRWSAIATAQAASGRRYRARVRGLTALLGLRKRTKVFQRTTVPDIIAEVLRDAGFPADALQRSLAGAPPTRTYVVQYAETDERFVRRLCEEEGLYFRFEPKEKYAALELCDTSSNARPALEEPLPIVDDSGLEARPLCATGVEVVRQRRPGKVTLRDHDPARPMLKLEGVSEAGAGVEREVEVYAAPGRIQDEAEGTRRAERRLEALRAEARAVRFRSTALALAPGLSVELTCDPGYNGSARPEGNHVVVALEHAWRADGGRYELRVLAIPAEVPFRLPLVTPRPRLPGLHSALVTGPGGEEIHADAEGRVKVRFFWDRFGPKDDQSSLPVRVVQPNMPGSMLIPRVGWEVMVAFEDGDPDRPYVIGRAYNGKQTPPVGLPANKTMSSLSTLSSPGQGARNAVTWDDAAGRQHLAWNAGFGRTTTVANNMKTHVIGNEIAWVGGAQKRTVGGDEGVSVKDAYLVDVGTQMSLVGVKQTISAGQMMGVKVASETVLVGGALIEKVGDPVKGLVELAAQLPSTVAGFGLSNPWLGAGLGAAWKIGWEGYKAVRDNKDPFRAMQIAGMKEGIGAGLSLVGGGDAIASALEGFDVAPWQENDVRAQGDRWYQPFKKEEGGGAGAAGAAGAGPAEAGPGHRIVKVGGGSLEIIQGAYGIATPGASKWTAAGASMVIVGGSHTTHAVKVSALNLATSTENSASLSITARAGPLVREIGGAVTTTVAGSYKSQSSGKHIVRTGSTLHLDVGGDLSLNGSTVVFQVKSSKVVVSSGGVMLKASKVVLPKKATQDGKATNK